MQRKEQFIIEKKGVKSSKQVWQTQWVSFSLHTLLCGQHLE